VFRQQRRWIWTQFHQSHHILNRNRHRGDGRARIQNGFLKKGESSLSRPFWSLRSFHDNLCSYCNAVSMNFVEENDVGDQGTVWMQKRRSSCNGAMITFYLSGIARRHESSPSGISWRQREEVFTLFSKWALLFVASRLHCASWRDSNRYDQSTLTAIVNSLVLLASSVFRSFLSQTARRQQGRWRIVMS